MGAVATAFKKKKQKQNRYGLHRAGGKEGQSRSSRAWADDGSEQIFNVTPFQCGL